MVSNTSKIRSIILTIFVVSFFSSLTVFLIFYIQGKTINDKGEIVNTGVLRVKSIPEDSKVFIDGEEVSKRGEIIRSIKFGERELSVEKDGYTTWTKQILINTSEVKEIDVQLYPTESKLKQLVNFNIDKIIYSNDTDFAFFTVISTELSSELGLWKFKLNTNLLDLNKEQKPEKIASFTQAELEDLKANEYSLLLSTDNNKIIVNSTSELNTKIYTTNELNTGRNLSKSLEYKPKSIAWLQSSKSLLINDGQISYEYFIDENKKYLINYYPDQNLPFCISQDSAYLYDTVKEELIRYRNGESTVLAIDTSDANVVDINCATDNKEKLILQTSTGFNYINFEENFTDRVDGNITILNVSKDGNSILYKDGENIYSYVIDLSTSAEKFTTKKTVIARESIDSINFSNTSKNLIISYNSDSDSENQNLELSDRDGLNKYSLIEGKNYYNDSIAIRNDSKELYIVLNSSLDRTNSNGNFNLYKIVLEE